MKHVKSGMAWALVALALTLSLASCEKGPAQKVGEKIDNAVDDGKEKVQDLKDDVKRKL